MCSVDDETLVRLKPLAPLGRVWRLPVVRHHGWRSRSFLLNPMNAGRQEDHMTQQHTMARSASHQPTAYASSAEEISTWLRNQVGAALTLNPCVIDPDSRFDAIGLDSLGGLTLFGDLEDWLDLELDPTLLYDFPSISQLAQAVADIVRDRQASSPPADRV